MLADRRQLRHLVGEGGLDEGRLQVRLPRRPSPNVVGDVGIAAIDDGGVPVSHDESHRRHQVIHGNRRHAQVADRRLLMGCDRCLAENRLGRSREPQKIWVNRIVEDVRRESVQDGGRAGQPDRLPPLVDEGVRHRRQPLDMVEVQMGD